MNSQPILQFVSVSKSFVKNDREIFALEGCSFSVDPGEFVAVIGPSGCGKSTLLNLAAGLYFPTSGEVLYSGSLVNKINTQIGYVTQSDTLLPWRTVVGNIKIGLEIRGFSKSESNELVSHYIKMVGLDGFENHYPSELSGGMRKRVSLARTLVYKPNTLIMDEPFGNLDAQLRIVMQNELRRIWADTGCTILLVTHDLEEAIILADRVIVFSARPGHVKQEEIISIPGKREVVSVRRTAEFSKAYDSLWESLREEIPMGENM